MTLDCDSLEISITIIRGNIMWMSTLYTSIFIILFLCQFFITITPDTSYLFSHGLADTHKQAYNYLRSPENPQKPYIIDFPIVTFNYPDATTNFMRVNRTQTSLAQDNEINRLAHVFNDNLAGTSGTILVGVSRGASALVNFMGKHNPQTAQALILESPFDCVENIVLGLINRARISWMPGAQRCGLALMRMVFSKYKHNGLRPIDVARTIRKDLPILIICSAQDLLVPVWSSINVYLALKESGNKDVYILILPQGSHAQLITHQNHAIIYQNIVHSFYQRYNLQHNPTYAALGKQMLEECQPDRGKLAHYFPLPTKKEKNTRKIQKKLRFVS